MMVHLPRLVTHLTNEFAPLTKAAIEFALAGEPTRERHDHALADIPAFNSLEYKIPEKFLSPREKSAFRISVFSWNAERLKYARPSHALLGSEIGRAHV